MDENKVKVNVIQTIINQVKNAKRDKPVIVHYPK